MGNLEHYDVIVVGARCAGAPTAMLLARKGHRVLMVDRAAFPSDTASTLLIHPQGVAALARWGLLDAVVATGCPAIERYSFDFGPITITGRPGPSEGVDVSYAPRRTVLDHILVRAAVDAGAELREGFTVDDLVVEGGVVTGIRGRDSQGQQHECRARIVIGADGTNSRVARMVDAPRYNEKPALQCSYYTFWRDLDIEGMETVIRPDRGWGAIPTNDGLTVVVVGWPMAEAAAYKSDVEANYMATLEMAPEFAKRIRRATRVERFTGGQVPNFFRQPFGPGWVLVGDAGYTKDPITAQGISNGFRDAEAASAAIDDTLRGTRPFDDAFAEFQRERDAHAFPVYEFTTQMATLEPPPPELQQLLAAIEGNAPAMDQFVNLVTGLNTAPEFFDPANIGRLLAPANA
jgi:flavin-dependent dehydrogenase